MLTKIAASAEAHRESRLKAGASSHQTATPETADEAIAAVVEYSIKVAPTSAVFVPTHSGTTARMISCYKPGVWIVALSSDPAVCAGLAFSYGVRAIHAENEPEDWRSYIEDWLHRQGIQPLLGILVAGPSTKNPNANYRVEFLRFPQVQ